MSTAYGRARRKVWWKRLDEQPRKKQKQRAAVWWKRIAGEKADRP